MGTVLTGVVIAADEVDTVLAATYLDTRLLAMLASLLVPLAVNFVTKLTASDGLKAVVNIVFVGILSVIALWINPTDQPITVWLCVNTFLSSLVASFVAYKGIWKPTGVSGSVAAATANVGIGSPPVLQTQDKGMEEVGGDVNDEVDQAELDDVDDEVYADDGDPIDDLDEDGQADLDEQVRRAQG